ncbi:MAG: serine protease [Clostridia bacterium]|nr:serine protease [Clostridia bacterium]
MHNGIGFAVPINSIKPIINSFINTGTFEEAYLGIFGYDKEVIPYLDYSIKFEDGIYIEEIDRTGPLKDSTLMRGDLIEKIDGIEVEKMTELRSYIYTKKPGDKVNLTIKRKNNEFDIQTTLGKR